MKVVVNGGWRTGSTMAFAAVRHILWAHYGDHRAALCDSGESVRQHLRKHGGSMALKCHVYVPTGDEPDHLIVHTVRNELDVIASLMRVKGFGVWEAAGEVLRQRAMLAATLREDIAHLTNHHIIKYEHAYAEPRGMVSGLAAAMGVDLSKRLAAGIAQQIAPAAVKQRTDQLTEQEQDTYLQPGHIGPDLGKPGAWKNVLSSVELAQARLALK